MNQSSHPGKDGLFMFVMGLLIALLAWLFRYCFLRLVAGGADESVAVYITGTLYVVFMLAALVCILRGSLLIIGTCWSSLTQKRVRTSRELCEEYRALIEDALNHAEIFRKTSTQRELIDNAVAQLENIKDGAIPGKLLLHPEHIGLGLTRSLAEHCFDEEENDEAISFINALQRVESFYRERLVLLDTKTTY